MARYNDMSYDYKRWTNKKLIARLKETANLETYSHTIFDSLPASKGNEATLAIRMATQIYRDTWMNPIIEEIERRFVKGEI